MQIFIQGNLDMSTVPWPGLEDAPVWADILTNQILIALCGIILLILLPDVLMITALVWDSLWYERSAVKLEHSLTTARIRNHLALFFIIPLALTADRFGLYSPHFLSGVPAYLSALTVIAAMLAYGILRDVLYSLFGPRGISAEQSATLHHGIYNYFIALVPVAVATGISLSILNVGIHTCKWVLYGESGLFFMMSFFRTGHFLAQIRGGFSTILYLCGLELVPAGLLIASATVV